MKIALIHYHLKSGGVTEVIIHSVRAILRQISEIDEIRLVTGSREGVDAAMARIRDGLERGVSDKLKLDVLGEVAYATDGQNLDVDTIARRLEARYGEDTLWWIHNYHLGKNPYFTAALMKIATAACRDMLLHIHYFPECGRIENQLQLAKTLDGPAYPTGSRIRYACINERDRRMLRDAGLGPSVTLLANPVPPPPQEDFSTKLLGSTLEKNFRATNPGYIPGGKNLLYPVRVIRRKNILEAAMLAILMEEQANVIVTLPGTSPQEQPYSDTIKNAYETGLIPGVWCPGLNYAHLAAGCSGIISTSIQEGFGYLFLNALHWRKPLLARYLDILDDVLDMYGEFPRRFWADFRVPVDKGLIQRTEQAYRQKIDAQRHLLSEKARKSLHASVNKIGLSNTMDISFLSVPDQLDMLKKAHDATWRNEARDINHELLESTSCTLLAKAPDMSAILSRRYGEKVFAKTFAGILRSFGEKNPPASETRIQEFVSKTFSRIDYFRLIYDY